MLRRTWSCFALSALAALASLPGQASGAPATDKPVGPTPAATAALQQGPLLQFAAGGHILGFKPGKVFFASLDHTIIEEFVGAAAVMPLGSAQQQSTEGVKGAAALGSVTYANLWQGITLKYESKSSGIAESTYALEPGADVNDIRLKYNVSAGIEKDGSLRFRHPSEKGYFSQSAPKAWQEIGGRRLPVDVAFADRGDDTIGFKLATYDHRYPLVIDPTYQWHSFYGSSGGADQGNAIAVDSTGNVYVTGYSTLTWNGPGGAQPVNAAGGSADIVVLKLNASGVYQWHTFLGAGGADIGSGIAVDTNGNAYVTGYSTAAWNGPGATPPLNAFAGGNDIVLLKLDSSGAYQWHTFYGAASGYERATAIAADTNGNVYVTGFGDVTWNGPGATPPLNAFSGSLVIYNMVVLKLNAQGAYQWHTFYGSAGATDVGSGIATDTGGNVYVTGYSTGTWDGPAAAAPLHAHSGFQDIVVLKLNTGGGYLWHTFYGSATGSGGDYGLGIAVDAGGNAYVTGNSDASWNGPGAAAPLNPFSGVGSSDAVVLKLNTNGAYQWHTFYGASSATDVGNGIALDAGGNVYVTGYSSATWNGPGAVPPSNPFSGGAAFDVMVLRLDTSGGYLWHAFYGSLAGTAIGNGIAVDAGSGSAYLTGFSNATWNGPGATPPLSAYSGTGDIVVLKLASQAPIAAPDSTSTLVGSGGSFDVSTNDTKPPGATYGLAGGSTCAGSGVSSAGLASYIAPSSVGASCAVNVQVCNPPPDGTTCAGSTLTVTAIADVPTTTAPTPVPTVNEWALMILMAVAGLGSVRYLRRHASA